MALELTLGCDPEVFVREKATGKFISAYGIVPGDKKNPFKVPYGAVQVDGLAAEFNIDPVDTREAWLHHIQAVMYELGQFLQPHYEMVITPTVEFDPDYFWGLPDEQRVLGCDPDFNAYTEEMNPRPTVNKPIRSAGGHIHIGFDKDRDVNDRALFEDCVEIAKQLDFYVGVPSVMLDTDFRRREIYGKAGCFRVKPYGIEYRTPSNVWLSHPEAILTMFDLTVRGVNQLYKGKAARQSYSDFSRNIINTNTNRSKWDWANHAGTMRAFDRDGVNNTFLGPVSTYVPWKAQHQWFKDHATKIGLPLIDH